MNGKLCATNWTSSERDQPYASRTTPLAWLRFRDRAVLLFELAKPMESLSESWCRQSMTGRLSEDNLLSLGALRKFHFLPCMHNKRKDRTVKYSNGKTPGPQYTIRFHDSFIIQICISCYKDGRKPCRE